MFPFCTKNNDKFLQMVQVGHVDLLKHFYHDPSLDNNLAIRIACSNGHHTVVSYLLGDPRVDPSADNNYGIRIAAACGHGEVVKILLQDHRVDPSADGNFAVKLAINRGDVAIVRMMVMDYRVPIGLLENCRMDLLDVRVKRKLQTLRCIVKCMGRLLVNYRRTVERIWAPGTPAVKALEISFYSI